MTRAIRPHPMTPTLSRPAMLHPTTVSPPAGTFHDPIRNPPQCQQEPAVARPRSRDLGDALLGVDARVIVLDRDRADPAIGPSRPTAPQPRIFREIRCLRRPG